MNEKNWNYAQTRMSYIERIIARRRRGTDVRPLTDAERAHVNAVTAREEVRGKQTMHNSLPTTNQYKAGRAKA